MAQASALAEKIKKLRAFRGLTQSEVVGGAFTRHYFSRIENGHTVPSPQALAIIADGLGVSISEFVDSYMASAPSPQQLCDLAVIMASEGHVEEALEVLDSRLPISVPQALRNHWKGRIYEATGDYPAAYEFYTHSLEDVEIFSNTDLLVQTLFRLGICARKTSQLTLAFRHYSEALSAFKLEKVRDEYLEKKVLRNLANVELILNLETHAIQHYGEALTLGRGHQDLNTQAASLMGLGTCYLNLGEIDEALDYLVQAETLYRAQDRQDMVALVIHNRAMALRSRGDRKKARELFNKSIHLKKYSGIPAEAVFSYNELTCMYLEDGEIDRADTTNQLAQDLLKKVTNPRERSLAYELAYRIELIKGSREKADSHLKKAISELGDDYTAHRGRLLTARGELAMGLGREGEALEIFRRTCRLFDEMTQRGDSDA